MAIYLINFISIIFYATFYSYVKDKAFWKKILITLLTIQLIVLLSLRSLNIGIDIPNYLNFFQNVVPNIPSVQFYEHRFEIGFKILTKVISLITLNGHIYLTIIAIIVMIPVGVIIYKYSKMPFLSFALYISFNFYAFSFSGLRQSIAYGIVLLSYKSIIERKFIRFLLIVLLASTFHKTAIVFLLAYPLSKVKLNKLTILLTAVLILVIYKFKRNIFGFVVDNIYTDYEIVETGAINWFLFSVAIIMFLLLFYKKIINQSSEINALYIIVILGVIIMMFSSIGTNVMRLANYFYIFIILLIPEVLSVSRNKLFAFYSLYFLIILISTLYLWFLLYTDTYQIVPYRFFWAD